MLGTAGEVEPSPAGPRTRDGAWTPSAVARADVELPRSSEAPRLARQCIHGMAGWQLDRREREIVDVLLTELVTNAVMHPGPDAGDRVGLQFAVAPDRVRVEVRDGGLGFTAAELSKPRSEPGGYGLVMVDRGSSRWGISRGDGNCVWFELDRN